MHFFKDQRLCPYILRETFEKSNQNISRLLSHRKMYMTSKISTPSIKTFIMDFYEVIFYEEEQLLCSYDSPGRCSLQFPQAQAPVQCKFFLYFLVKGSCKFLNVVQFLHHRLQYILSILSTQYILHRYLKCKQTRSYNSKTFMVNAKRVCQVITRNRNNYFCDTYCISCYTLLCPTSYMKHIG